MFIKVESVEKNCTVIVNLDHIFEIAPLATGGCALFTTDGAGMNSRSSMVVKDDFTLFEQFVLQTVSSADIQKRFPKTTKEKAPIDDLVPPPVVEPTKMTKGKGELSEYKIPKL